MKAKINNLNNFMYKFKNRNLSPPSVKIKNVNCLIIQDFMRSVKVKCLENNPDLRYLRILS